MEVDRDALSGELDRVGVTELTRREPAPEAALGLDGCAQKDTARKLLFLAVQNAVPQWTRTPGGTKAPLAFQFGDGLPD